MAKCLRCGVEFSNPVPNITNPEGGITEIATVHWCQGCNAVAVSTIFREKCVYQVFPLKMSTGKLGFFNMPRSMPNADRT